MEKEKSIFFDTKPLFISFEEHLTEDNKNIIFSAPFGKGKSTFINEYFSKHIERYNCIKISPVHYSICNNEDIYSLLKYDIICELLDTSDVSTDKEFTCFENIKYNSLEIANIICSTIVKNIPKIGKRIDTCTKMISKINTLLKETNKPKSDILYEKVMSLEEYKYFLADDFIVNYCNDKLVDIKKNDKKTNVLVIDDLDRLDPEHIFRLLNIFSTYTDDSFSGNKYVFDHIIFVCDIDNIRKIYAHKYGESVDFEGYINKFCTREIFHFDLMEEIRKSYHTSFENLNNKISNIYSILCLEEIVFILLENEIINFRDLLNIQTKLNRHSKKIEEINLNSYVGVNNSPTFLINKFGLNNVIKDRVSRNLKLENQEYTVLEESNIYRKIYVIPNKFLLGIYLNLLKLMEDKISINIRDYIKIVEYEEKFHINYTSYYGLKTLTLFDKTNQEIPISNILIHPLRIIKDFVKNKLENIYL